MTAQWNRLFSMCAQGLKETALGEILKITQKPDIISFAGGFPAADLFPTERFLQAAEAVLTKHGKTALQYTVTEGIPALRHFIADYMKKRQVHIGPDNVLITGGSQQGIDLVGKIFLDPGDGVAIESPSYLGAIQSLQVYRPKFAPVPMDDQGISTQALETILTQNPVKIAYVIPNYQNPSGISLAHSRRQELIRLTREHSFVLVEDDPYSALGFESDSELSLMALGQQADSNPLVIYLGTFSKILAPSIRLGWVVAPEEIIKKLAQAKQASDLHESTLLQMMTVEVVQDNFLDKHLEIVRKKYRERRDAMLEAIEKHFPGGIRWTRPGGGLFIWVTLPEGKDTTLLLQKAVSMRVAFVPGADFHIDSRGRNTMRLNFSNTTLENIQVGIPRLGKLLKQELGE